jgi:iron only hydrogenase large subunit-like protein
MDRYFHSVRLDEDKCKGCTVCIKGCPTEAIRVRDGKAHIIEERCIDCGECIRKCANHAKLAITDSLDDLKRFKYRVALPAPALMGQFRRDIPPEKILGALLKLGFDEVFEVALGADYVTAAIKEYLKKENLPRPLISSACPAVVRLIQVRFPDLLPHIIPLETPMEIGAKMVKEKLVKEKGIPLDDIGVFFITPCPAKVTAVKEPVGVRKSSVDGVIPIADVYGAILKAIPDVDKECESKASGFGVGWARAGGENAAVGLDNYLSVDGIQNVISLLEEVEMGKLDDVAYLECLSCPGGCIAGPLTVENKFISRVRIRQLADKKAKPFTPDEDVAQLMEEGYFSGQEKITPRPIMQLDTDITKAIKLMAELENTLAELPGIDCGSCGAPTCRALAEDIVKGLALETDCVFKLREKVHHLAKEMLELSEKVPPAMGKKNNGK